MVADATTTSTPAHVALEDDDDAHIGGLHLLCHAATPMLMETNSDESSTASSVLNMSEYKSTTWTEIVSYGVPTIGIAFLAITHPIMFIAGATVSLLGVGGAYAVDASDCASLCGRTDKDEKELPADSILPVKEIATKHNRSSEETYIENHLSSATTDVEEDFEVPAPLGHMICNKAEFSSLHAKKFFQIFFGDDAPFSFKDFQKQRGDVNIVYSPWAGTDKRIISFQTPTKQPFFGPSHATATKSQVLIVNHKRCVIMESTTRLQDIPFCDRFCVREQWVFTSSHDKICTIRVSAQVEFTKSCAFEQQIVSKSMSTLEEVFCSWQAMAQKALILTARRLQEEEVKPLDDEIEVAYQSERRKSCVLGEISDEDEDDWEMDPVVKVPKQRRSLRQSFKFLKRQ